MIILLNIIQKNSQIFYRIIKQTKKHRNSNSYVIHTYSNSLNTIVHTSRVVSSNILPQKVERGYIVTITKYTGIEICMNPLNYQIRFVFVLPNTSFFVLVLRPPVLFPRKPIILSFMTSAGIFFLLRLTRMAVILSFSAIKVGTSKKA
jgi:hypothetical protein